MEVMDLLFFDLCASMLLIPFHVKLESKNLKIIVVYLYVLSYKFCFYKFCT